MKINWKIISISTLLLHLHAAAAPHQEKEHRKDAFSSAAQKSDSLISAKAELINGRWFINGKYRPVLKTSMTKTNFLEIMNVSITVLRSEFISIISLFSITFLSLMPPRLIPT